jgi:hypothetical protein
MPASKRTLLDLGLFLVFLVGYAACAYMVIEAVILSGKGQ